MNVCKWMDGWTDGWMGRRTYERIGIRTDGWMDGWTDDADMEQTTNRWSDVPPEKQGKIHRPRRCAWRCSFFDLSLVLWNIFPSKCDHFLALWDISSYSSILSPKRPISSSNRTKLNMMMNTIDYYNFDHPALYTRSVFKWPQTFFAIFQLSVMDRSTDRPTDRVTEPLIVVRWSTLKGK